MYHNYVDALLSVGRREKALEVLRNYWGGMLEAGADTFWELYNPENPDESPMAAPSSTAIATHGAALRHILRREMEGRRVLIEPSAWIDRFGKTGKPRDAKL